MAVLSVFLCVALVALVLLHRWVCRHNDFFQAHGVPFLRPVPFFGNMFRVFFKKKSMAEVLQNAFDSSPEAKYVGFFDFTTPVIIVRDPELLKQITIDRFDEFSNHQWFPESLGYPYFCRSLVALNGHEWREMRELLSPLFSLANAKLMFHRMSHCATNLSDFMAREVPTWADVISNDLFHKYSLDVIAKMAFGISINSLRDQNNKFIRINRFITRLSIIQMLSYLLVRDVPAAAKWLKMKKFNDDEVNFFSRIVSNEIARRRREGIATPDVIHMLTQAKGNADGPGAKLDLVDITAQAFLVLLGGLDHPARTLNRAALEIALNKDVQMKLQQEIDEVLKRCGGRVTYEALHDMKYLDAVISEVLRLYPITYTTDRACSAATELPPALPGLRPFPIPAGTNIWLPLICLHRDRNYFPDPERFDPERFLGANRSKILPYTYFPFGLGPRSCPAIKFTLMQLKLAIFHVLAKCNLYTAPRIERMEDTYCNPFFLLSEGSHSVRVVRRCKRDRTFRIV